MNDLKFDLVYTIKPKSGNYSWEANELVSNISGEEKVKWEISKSLSDRLIELSASLKPEQMLLEYAEMQRRSLQTEIECLNDLELEIRQKTNQISSILDKALAEQETVWEEKLGALVSNVDKFTSKVRSGVA